VSFILDALRKSEHERQRQAGPAIADLPVARATSRPPLTLLAVGALLAVNLAVLLYFMLRTEAPEVLREEPVAAAPAGAVAGPPQQAPAAAIVPPRPAVAAPARREVRPLTREAAPEPAQPPGREAPDGPDPSLLPPAPALLPPPVVVSRPQPGVSRVAGESIPRIDTLPAQATAGLPALNLDLHIFSTDPAQRAAFINGRRYREGDTMPEGVEVSAITPDGAVLSYRGQRFLLPRQ
jgi:general secretion pathway protein B